MKIPKIQQYASHFLPTPIKLGKCSYGQCSIGAASGTVLDVLRTQKLKEHEGFYGFPDFRGLRRRGGGADTHALNQVTAGLIGESRQVQKSKARHHTPRLYTAPVSSHILSRSRDTMMLCGSNLSGSQQRQLRQGYVCVYVCTCVCNGPLLGDDR